MKYSNLCKPTACEVHNDGEIWATALWNLRKQLLARYGFIPGKAQAEQLVIDGLKNTSTNPTFLTARDAIFAADKTNNPSSKWKGCELLPDLGRVRGAARWASLRRRRAATTRNADHGDRTARPTARLSRRRRPLFDAGGDERRAVRVGLDRERRRTLQLRLGSRQRRHIRNAPGKDVSFHHRRAGRLLHRRAPDHQRERVLEHRHGDGER